MSELKEAVILVGHGGIPADCPGELVSELKRLEAQRRASGRIEMSPREAELDARIRDWPRTPETDPYAAGLESIAARLAPRVAPRRLVVAYNEFCAPSLESAIEDLVVEGFQRLVLTTTMFTPGGSHSELEIPEIVEQARKLHPEVDIRYAWPFDLDRAAGFLAEQISRS
ncbi:MAG: CbiX/SirB N-terminal domain-containing protein [Deltaproteobacteria bacterium]|jgi:sirohydrochlorin cobaltochelatase